nr:SDR family NAD(P)-dependent oxidoreductase [Paenibacillus xylanexedens]
MDIFKEQLWGESDGKSTLKMNKISKNDIAVVGMAAKFPMAEHLSKFWGNLTIGLDGVRTLSGKRKKDADAVFHRHGKLLSEIEYNDYAYLDDIDNFDYSFFGLSAREATLMDPHQRIFLETAWHALEDAGYGGENLKGSRTGTFVGFSNDFVSEREYKRIIAELLPESMALSLVGNMKSIIASRLAYILDFHGPAVIVDTTCSSSLMAVHWACQSIRSGECDQALAGGVDLNLLPLKIEESQRIGIESSDYRTKSFDDRSDGAGSGEGVGVVLLKPLHRALEDRDHIYAVVKGSASNQDGSSMSITAPNPAAQEDVIIKAWQNANVSPESISYVEAHGSGTKIGDPIEIEGLTRAFSRYTNKKQFCAIGSIKTNIGHLGSAAGIAGFIKASLALKNKLIPASIHFIKPNKRIKFTSSPVYVNNRLRPWKKTGGTPLRCGVSSFGISGTNCHMILEEAPPIKLEEFQVKEQKTFLLPLSGKNESSLLRLVAAYESFVEKSDDFRAEDVCFTALKGRGHYKFRLAILFQSKDELLCKLRAVLDKNELSEVGITQGLFVGQSDEEATEESQLLDGTSGSLEEIALRYIEGKSIEWSQICPEPGRKMSLPLYPFEETRCWIQMNERPEAYTVRWKKTDNSESNLTQSNGRIVFFHDGSSIGNKLLEAMENRKFDIVIVTRGNDFERIDGQQYIFKGECYEDYASLVENIAMGGPIEKVIYFATGSLPKELKASELNLFENSQILGVYGLFFLIKALLNKGLEEKIGISIITSLTQEVTGTESSLHAENATAMGLGKIIKTEYDRINCRAIDIDDSTTSQMLLAEWGYTDRPYLVAIRDGQPYVQEFDLLNEENDGGGPLVLRESGAYLITGGTGGIGLEIAKQLSSENQIHLILLHRSDFPDRTLWNQLLSDTSEDYHAAIHGIMQIERSGSRVTLLKADVADEHSMSLAYEYIQNHLGPLAGIIHAAGVAGQGYLMQKETDTFTEVLAPKVHGTWLIDKLTESEELDFFIVFSSISSLIPSVGQGDYTAANCYLDSFALERSKRGKRTISINWTKWSEVGLALKFKHINHDDLFIPLSNSEAIEGFSMFMQMGPTLAIIGNVNDAELEKWVSSSDLSDILISPGIQKRIARRDKSQVAAAKKSSKNVGAEIVGYSSIEQQLVEIWSELFGKEKLSIHDNFYELGGDSLLATHLLRHVNQVFPSTVDITDIYSHPTVSSMASIIESRTGQSPEQLENSVDHLLNQLSEGDLSVDEIARMMEAGGDKSWNW